MTPLRGAGVPGQCKPWGWRMLRCSLAINTVFGHRGIRNTLKWVQQRVVYWCSVAKVALGCDLPKVVQVFDVEQF